MSVEAYVQHATALLALSGEADSRLRRQQATAERTAQQVAGSLERERRELTELRARLDASLRRAREERALAHAPAAQPVDPVSDPVDLLGQLIERLDAAIADAAHARRALETQRTREREQARKLEQEAQRRRALAEAEQRRTSRRTRLLDRSLLAAGVLAAGGAAAGFVAGATAAGAPAAALALAVFGVAGWRRHAR